VDRKDLQLVQFIGSYSQMEKAMLNVNSFTLTLEQEFLISVAKQSAEGMTREQMFDLLLDTTRLAMVRDNIIRDLMRDKLSQPEI
jgi:Phycobilisome degradation protein nblA